MELGTPISCRSWARYWGFLLEKKMDPKEKLEGKEAADRKEPTEKSPFDILDEVEQEGDFTLGSISDEVDAEVEKERQEAEGEGTGLKGDKDNEEAADETGTAEEPTEEKEEKKTADESENEEEEAEKEEPEEEAEEEEKTATDHPQWLIDKIKEADPELDLNDEEAVQTAVDNAFTGSKEADQVRKDLENEREANKAFYDLLEGSDELREVSKYMHKHNTGFSAALSALDIAPETDLETLKKEDPDAYVEAVRTKEKREKEAAEAEEKRKEREGTFQENEKKSFQNAEAVKNDLKMDDAAFEEFTGQVNKEIEGLSQGLVSKNLLNIFHRGLNYEDAVAKAREEGLTEGKNMKIEEHTSRKKGDNLPRIDTGASKVAEKEEDDIFTRAMKPEPRISEIN